MRQCPYEPGSVRLGHFSLDCLSSKIGYHRDSFEDKLKILGEVSGISLRMRGGNGSTEDHGLQYAMLRLSDCSTAWTGLQSIALHSMYVLPNALHILVKENAATLRQLRVTDCGLTFSTVASLVTIPDLKLTDIHITERYTPRSKRLFIPGRELCEILNRQDPSKEIGEYVIQEKLDRLISSQELFVDTTYDACDECVTEDDTVAEALARNGSSASDESLILRQRNAPCWAWGRYFHDPEYPEGRAFYWPVPNNHPHAHATTWWKFVSRTGEVAIGDDPLTWFEDWDLSAGDSEFPTPFSQKFIVFCRGKMARVATRFIIMSKVLGEKSPNWLALVRQQPPPGALPYDEHDDKELAAECLKDNF